MQTQMMKDNLDARAAGTNSVLRDDLRPAAADDVPAGVLTDHVEAGGFGWPVSGDLTTIERGVWLDPARGEWWSVPSTPVQGITSGRLSPIVASTSSLAALWNLDAADLNAKVRSGSTAPVAVDGDAHLRTRASLLAANEATNREWAKARADYFADVSEDREAIRRTQEIRDRYREALEASTRPGCVCGHDRDDHNRGDGTCMAKVPDVWCLCSEYAARTAE